MASISGNGPISRPWIAPPPPYIASSSPYALTTSSFIDAAINSQLPNASYHDNPPQTPTGPFSHSLAPSPFCSQLARLSIHHVGMMGVSAVALTTAGFTLAPYDGPLSTRGGWIRSRVPRADSSLSGLQPSAISFTWSTKMEARAWR